MNIIWIIVALVAGCFLPIQAGFNAKIGQTLGSPIQGALVSFVVGTIALSCYALFSRQPVAWSNMKAVPSYAWLSGVLGAFYVTAVILAFPKLGAALTFGLVVAGQLVIALLLDHFQVLVAEQHPVNGWRILGILLIVAGVIIIRKF